MPARKRTPDAPALWRRLIAHENARTVAFHLGIVLFCVGYVALGAFVFFTIERPLELEAARALARAASTAWRPTCWRRPSRCSSRRPTARSSPSDSTSGWRPHERRLLLEFADPVTANYFDSLAYNRGEYVDLWTPSSAFLLATTTIIPVGFGLVTPRSPLGRLLLVLYAIVGIPLALVTISDLGRFLCDFVFRLFRGSTRAAVALLIGLVAAYPLVMGLVIWKYSAMSLVDSYYYCVTSIFTIGFGDMLPPLPVPLLILFLSCGVILMTVSVEVAGSAAIHRMHYVGRQVGRAREFAGRFIQASLLSQFKVPPRCLQLAHANINTGLGAGMSQLNSLARFGLLMVPGMGNARPPTPRRTAYEPGIPLEFVDLAE
ncbi:Ion transport 2 domain containing protein [Aphelenchoides fujianensis]|nr:Ion transport 2 domain containing protein [Aphelenchoides fujianensis]